MHRRPSLVIVLLAAGLSGCATFAPPQPWEKGQLARPHTQPDPSPLEAHAPHHISQSQEGAGGRSGVGGGGCGCN